MKVTLLIVFVFIAFAVAAQQNSVELKNGSNTTIGQYASITAAYSAIPASVTESYIIEILTLYNGSSETFPIVLNIRSGASAVNTITIRPAAGNTGEVITATVSNNPVINISDADYIIIDGRPGGTGTLPDLTISNTGTSGSSTHTLRFIDGACNNMVRNCKLTNGIINTAGPRVVVFGTSASNTSGNSFNTLTDCQITGSRSGIASDGTAANPNTNITIRNCEIKDFTYAGIWLLGSYREPLIENCTIYTTNTAGTSTIISGISISAISGTTLNIRNNKIYSIATSATGNTTPRGVTVSMGTGSTVNLQNNFISLDNTYPGSTSTLYGLYLAGSVDYTANIYFNTIYIAGTHNGGISDATVSAALFRATAGAGGTFNAKNNILINKRTGGASGVQHVGSHISSTVGTLNINNNTYFASGGTNSYAAGWGTTLYNTLAAYQAAAAPSDVNTNFKDVSFISNTNLHLAGTSVGDRDLTGIPVSGIETDIDGETRGTVFPYKGADENLSAPLPLKLASFTSQLRNNNNLSLYWKTVFESGLQHFVVERKLIDGNWQALGTVHAAGNSNIANNYSFTDPNLTSGTYLYRLKIVEKDGNYSYTNQIRVTVGTHNEYVLHQNYPNPTAGETIIGYEVAAREKVLIILYDVSGKQIQTIMNEIKEPGSYQVSVNLQQLVPGSYYYRMRAGYFSSVRQLIVK